MLQQQIRHDPDTFPRCRLCGHEPRHIEAHGSHSAEVFDVLHPTGTRHALECRCDQRRRTPWMPTLDAAIAYWRNTFAVASRPRTSNVRSILRLHKDAG